MKRFICAVLVCVCFISLVACSKFDENYVYDGRSLVGTWCDENYDEKGYESYNFYEDGTVELVQYYYGIEFQRVSGTYSAEGNKMVIDIKQFDDTNVHYEHKFCITDKGELVVIYLSEKDQMTEEEMVLKPFNNEFNEGDTSLVGTWEDTNNRGEYWSFNSDFTGKVSNETSEYKMYYSVHGGKLYMAYEFVEGVKQSLVELDYKVSGNTLTLEGKIDGTSLKYSFERK